MIRILILAALLIGCTESTAVPEPKTTDELWICHNPSSSWHGSLCNEECYWDGFERAADSYCWLLRPGDCEGDLLLAWQRDNCYLFGGEDAEVH